MNYHTEILIKITKIKKRKNFFNLYNNKKYLLLHNKINILKKLFDTEKNFLQ